VKNGKPDHHQVKFLPLFSVNQLAKPDKSNSVDATTLENEKNHEENIEPTK
jgi:hypothetical protein